MLRTLWGISLDWRETMPVRKMDQKAQRYRERAKKLQRIVDGAVHGATRDNLIENIAELKKNGCCPRQCCA